MDHPNIIKFHDWIKEDEKIFIVLEFAEGGNLFNYLEENHKLSAEDVKRFVYQTCSSLIYLHDRGVLHRDIKPENLLLDENFNVKLCDFGLSSVVSDVKHRYDFFHFCGSSSMVFFLVLYVAFDVRNVWLMALPC